MSKKVLSIGLSVAGFALMAIPGVGTAIGIGMLAARLVGTGLMIASNVLIGPAKPRLPSTTPCPIAYKQ